MTNKTLSFCASVSLCISVCAHVYKRRFAGRGSSMHDECIAGAAAAAAAKRCIACETAEADMLCSPCGHVVACEACVTRWNRSDCWICRAHVHRAWRLGGCKGGAHHSGDVIATRGCLNCTHDGRVVVLYEAANCSVHARELAVAARCTNLFVAAPRARITQSGMLWTPPPPDLVSRACSTSPQAYSRVAAGPKTVTVARV